MADSDFNQSASPAAPAIQWSAHRPTLLGTWLWFLARNILGWLLIVAAILTGWLPGPGGIPLFLIGFGLITFPGKRRIMARVLRGKPLDRQSRGFRFAAFVTGVCFPAAALVYLGPIKKLMPSVQRGEWAILAVGYVAAALLVWFSALHSGPLLDRLLRIVARARRTFRPKLRRHGIDLLPPRRRRRFHPDGSPKQPTDDVLELHDHFRDRLKRMWKTVKPWLRRALGIVLTVAIFVWILKPIVRNWDQVGDRILATNWWRVLGASVIFAAFLFFSRALTWRKIIKGMGHKLPVAAATRIWSTSELARYLPGAIWQVIGRAYLAKPYGVSGSICSTSQVLELSLFLLANLIMAVSCLLFLGFRAGSGMHGSTRVWLFVAAALVPVLIVLIHPRIFYPAVNRILRKLGKPRLTKQFRFSSLLHMLIGYLAGLCLQGLAIWLVVHHLLNLPIEKWWVVTGAYCLAWCAGFLAFWAPGGLGVREAVFIAAMDLALPLAVRQEVLGDVAQKGLFLIFLSVLLRIWATVGELILSGLAYLFDMKGALGIDPPRHPKRGFEVITQPEGRAT